MAATALRRAHGWLERHRALPYPHTPPEATPAERRRWLLLMLAGWLTMGGALLAASALLSSRLLLLEMTVLVVLAFPVVWRLHFSTFPRFWVNQVTFLSAVIVGIIQWRLGIFTGGEASSGLLLSYRTLVGFFYWVMAFRAFAIRNVRDLTQTALPAVSGLLLLLIAAPTVAAITGTALVLTGTLAMLAGEQSTRRMEGIDEVVTSEQVRGGTWRPRLNSWVSLLVAGAIAASIVAGVATRVEPSNAVGQWLRRQLAWRLARLMIGEANMPYGAEQSLSLAGPGPESRDRLMLVLEAESAMKIRTAAYDLYLGREWQQSEREWTRMRSTLKTWDLPAPEGFGLSSEVTEDVDVKITPGYGFIGALPVPWCPKRISLNAPSIRYDRSGMIVFNGHLLPGDTYTATVAMPDAVSAPPGSPVPPPVDLENALQLPPGLPQSVRDLTGELVAQTSGRPVEIAVAIESHLRSTYEYDLEAPPLPEAADFIEHFLFVSKRGWCNHYASAMVVMLRIAGIPARLATGFTSGEWVPDREHFEIRDQDAHAWAEVYLPDTGWIDFDPTPAHQEPATVTEGVTDTVAQIGVALTEAGRWVRANLLLSITALVLLMLAVLGLTYAARWYRRRLTPLRRGAPGAERVIYAYRQSMRWLDREGLHRPASAAPWEFQRTVALQRPALATDLSLLTDAYTRARFSACTPSDAAVRDTEQALARLRDAIFEPELDQGGSAG